MSQVYPLHYSCAKFENLYKTFDVATDIQKNSLMMSSSIYFLSNGVFSSSEACIVVVSPYGIETVPRENRTGF